MESRHALLFNALLFKIQVDDGVGGLYRELFASAAAILQIADRVGRVCADCVVLFPADDGACNQRVCSLKRNIRRFYFEKADLCVFCVRFDFLRCSNLFKVDCRIVVIKLRLRAEMSLTMMAEFVVEQRIVPIF